MTKRAINDDVNPFAFIDKEREEIATLRAEVAELRSLLNFYGASIQLCMEAEVYRLQRANKKP